ncbi:hypothetical protein, partial [Pseudomonas sp. RA_35y_Pfl2_P32]|uniref:hypothetical protein n=1 Tax=Pseudomonas sp. RA_35y_Pfl2_P32 TaxID=3088705 RepID=UPI0030D9080E
MRHKLTEEQNILLDSAARLALSLSGQDVPKAIALLRRRLRSLSKPQPHITADRLRERVTYDPDTGEFRWLLARKDRVGEIAGVVSRSGYRRIKIDDVEYYAHR